MRLKRLTSVLLTGFAETALAQAAAAPPAEVPKAEATPAPAAAPAPARPAFDFALHGFVSATLYVQDANTYPTLGQGVVSALSAAGTYTTDKPIFGGDVRQTRLNFSVKGPQVMGGATPKGVVEVDFGGAAQIAVGAPVTVTCPTPGTGGCSAAGTRDVTPAAYGGSGEQSLLPRLRYAYVELDWGDHTLWIGQQQFLVYAMVPTTLTHIATTLGYSTGNIGWRAPGIFGFHRFGDPSMRHELAWEVGAAGWNFGSAPVSGANQFVTAGGASGLPMVQLRYTLSSGRAFSFWVAGTWNQLDLNGPNAEKTSCNGGTACSTKQVIAGAAGVKLAMSGFTLAGAGWSGKNTGFMQGNLNQFTPNDYVGDLFGWGVWGQVGYNFTNELSLWYMFGSSQIRDWAYARTLVTGTGAGAITRLRNDDSSLLLQFRDGGFAMGLEYVNFFTTVRASATANDVARANQYALTTNYYF